MIKLRYSLLAIASIAPFFWATPAFAQAADLAKKLVAEAKTLKDAGKLSEACSTLDRAYEMDAKDGILFARADCRDQERKIAQAVNLYEAYLRSYGRMTGPTKKSHADRAASAEARLNELRPLVPMIKFVWAQQPPPETKIVVDKIEYHASTLDVRLPLEPGTHEIIVLLPGEPERRRTVTLAEGGSTIVDLTPLEAKPVEENKIEVVPRRTPLSKPKAPEKQKLDPWAVGGFVGVGVGGAGLIAGSILGGLAISDKKVVDKHCDAGKYCDPQGLDAAHHFQTVGNASTATFIVGGLFATVGATLLVLAYRSPTSPQSTAQVRAKVGPGMVQLGIDGAF